jgi:hypothetical protein
LKLPSQSEITKYVNDINAQLPAHALWDGYYIRKFKKKNLVIGGSQDWIYYHNIDLIFKKVSFYNLPAFWRDTAIIGDDVFRLSSSKEFKSHHPDFEIGENHVFAFDLFYNIFESREQHTFFVLAKTVFFRALQRYHWRWNN